MNAKILTLHALCNPGSVFQAYALETYIRGLGVNAVIIDYRPAYLYTEGSNSKFAWLKFIIKKIVYYKSYRSRKIKFEEFINNRMHLTPRVTTYKALELDYNNFDYYVLGSDQLWNSDYKCGNDGAFYLKFVKSGVKIAYATSVGKAKIDEHNLSILKNELPQFDKISVREESTSVYLTQKLGININWVCDPVFLLGNSEYRQLFLKYKCKCPYAVVYLSDSNSILDEIVSHYRRQGLKIILLGGFTKRCYCDEHMKNAGPLDFLSLIDSANIVISSSFHATAFSHIFHKKFVTIVPHNNGERIYSLLRLTKLEYRGVVKNGIDFGLIDKDINWDETDKLLAPHIKASKDFLTQSLDL